MSEAEEDASRWALVSSSSDDETDRYRSLCSALEETSRRSPALDSALRLALYRVTVMAAASRLRTAPRAALYMVDGCLLRCRDAAQRSQLAEIAETLQACLPHEGASLNCFPDVVDQHMEAAAAHRLPLGTKLHRHRVIKEHATGGLEAVLMGSEEPILLSQLAADWPALKLWSSPAYLKRRFGSRTVPVEVGVAWLEHVDGKQQQLVRFGDFVDEVLRLSASTDVAGGWSSSSCSSEEAVAVSERVPVTSAGTRAYLAQHRLFDQIPSLRDDLPDLFSTTGLIARLVGSGPRHPQEPLYNAWFGAGGVVTPLHFDKHPNLLCQIVGTKLVLTWKQEADLPRNGSPNENTSPLDVECPLLTTPLPSAKIFLLRPGDVLYIPKGTWHYVRALTTCFSVSVWF